MKKTEKAAMKIYLPLFALLIIVIVSAIVVYIRIEQKGKLFTGTSSMMGVQVRQTLYGDDAEQASERARERVQYLEDRISHNIDGSDIERVNSGAGEKWVRSSPETIETMDKLLNVSRMSRGILDPTVLPIMMLWGFDGSAGYIPGKSEIDRLLLNVDYRDIRFNRDVGRIKLDNRAAALTLKQVEKGAACREAISVYKDLKIKYGVVSIGGAVGVYGEKPDKAPWKISVRDPFRGNGEETGIAAVRIYKGYAVTFGGRDDKIDVGGVQCNKEIDVRTGKPVDNAVVSVTVLHPDAVIASALAHVCSIMDRFDSFEMLNYYGAEAIFIYNNKDIYATPNIRDGFTIINSDYKLID